MFNPLTPAQLAAVVSSVLADSADWQRPLEPFQQGQLRSASSISKHLAAELQGATSAVARFRDSLGVELDRAHAAGEALGEWSWVEAVAHCQRAVETAGDPGALGVAIATLVESGTAAGSEAFARFRPRLHAVLRELADAEVAVLSAAVDPLRGA